MKIQHDVNLKPYNTFQLDCIAAYFVEIKQTNDFQELIEYELFHDLPRLILGGGSNILLTQQRFDGLVIKNNILGKEIREETNTHVTLQVGAGENRDEFVRRTIDQGYCGLENLISIPGTVGAAPMQNIGAYGVEVGSYIDRVDYIDIGIGSYESLPGAGCKFGYRDSIFKKKLKNRVFITHVTFTLEKYNPETYTPVISYGVIQDELHKQASTPLVKGGMVSEANQGGFNNRNVTPILLATTIADIRASKLPDRTKIGTAGSFFKNPIVSEDIFNELKQEFPNLTGFPVEGANSNSRLPGDYINSRLPVGNIKLSAGQLIDLSGLKGITRGSVGTYKNHALVLVHHGGGIGEDIVHLAKHIQQKVFDTFGVRIEPEVNYISSGK